MHKSLSVLWSAIKSHLFPQIIHTADSKYNGHIQIVKVAGSLQIRVDGYTQTGGFVDTIWQKSIQSITSQPHTVLIVGFAGGSAARAVRQRWPHAKITGIDIDPVIISLGKKYFHTHRLKNCRIVIADIFIWIKSNRRRFDLILIDLFKGGTIPCQLTESEFLSQLHRAAIPHGNIIINYFPVGPNQVDLKSLLANARPFFGCINTKQLYAETIVQLAP